MQRVLPVVTVLPDGERRLLPVAGEKKRTPGERKELAKRSPLRQLHAWAERKLRPVLVQCLPPTGFLRRRRDAQLRQQRRRAFRGKCREFYRRDRNGRQVAPPPCPISPEKE